LRSKKFSNPMPARVDYYFHSPGYLAAVIHRARPDP
jgi:hypothetical protein